jgi:hypothetical protein
MLAPLKRPYVSYSLPRCPALYFELFHNNQETYVWVEHLWAGSLLRSALTNQACHPHWVNELVLALAGG